MNYKLKFVKVEDVINLRHMSKRIEGMNMSTLLNYLSYVYEILEKYSWGCERVNLRNRKLLKKYNLILNPNSLYEMIQKLTKAGVITNKYEEFVNPYKLNKNNEYINSSPRCNLFDIDLNKFLSLLEYVSFRENMLYPGYSYSVSGNRYTHSLIYSYDTYQWLYDYGYDDESIHNIVHFNIIENPDPRILPIMSIDCNEVREKIKKKQIRKTLRTKEQWESLTHEVKAKDTLLLQALDKISKLTDLNEKNYIKVKGLDFGKYKDEIIQAFINKMHEDELFTALIEEAETTDNTVAFKIHLQKYSQGFRIWYTARQTSELCKMHKADGRDDMLKQKGFINEYDIHSTIQSVSKAITTGELDLNFSLKDELMKCNFKKVDGSDVTRDEIKAFGFRHYFTTSYRSAWSQYQYSLKTDNLPEISHDTFVKMMRRSLELIGNEVYGVRIFMYESLIELRTINLLKEMGCKVANIYDCFYIDKMYDIESVIYEAFEQVKEKLK